jgi:type VI secretion system secreted protein VgrG
MASVNTELHFECEDSDIAWVVESAALTEGLNSSYTLSLSLSTDDENAEPALLLGAVCGLSIERGDVMRRVKGLVVEVHEGHAREQRLTTQLSVVSAFALMRQRTNTRIYQEMSVPEILSTVLGEGLSVYNRTSEQRLGRTYPVCEYRTQYEETDFAFCQRLMEEEGIVYWFEHDDDAELLVLSDSPEQYDEVEGLHGAMIEFTEFQADEGGHEAIQSFNIVSQLRPTKVVTKHYDWTHPPMPVEGDSSENEPGEDATEYPHGGRLGPDRENYEHDHEPLTFHSWNEAWTDHDVTDQVRLRRDQQIYDVRVAGGGSTVIGMTAGRVFEMTGHPRPEFNGRYLVLSVNHSFEGNATNSFHCIPADAVFRPRRIMPKPRISSVQTATVTGPNGEEIHTDLHGRIKVQFHWDREGGRDEHSSCFVRVVQPWAGPGWGFVFLPRIGMEVVVTFVNGDPDQPLVTGTVYNGENRTPYPLPGDKTKSTIKTQTSPGGGGSNEIRFEDAAGAEELYIHGQLDYNTETERDTSTQTGRDNSENIGRNESLLVGVDRSVSVGNDETYSVSNDQKINIGNCQTQNIAVNQTEEIGANQALTVGADQAIAVTGNRTIEVGGNEERTIAGNQEQAISGNREQSISGNDELAVSGNQEQVVSGNREKSVSGNDELAVSGNQGHGISGNREVVVSGNDALEAGGNVDVNAGSNMTLVAGSEAGLQAATINVTASGEIVLSAGGSSVKISGAGVEINGATVKAAGGSVEITGGVVKIN